MIVCYRLDPSTTEVLGVWWQVGDCDEFDFACREEIGVAEVIGVDTMAANTMAIDWPTYWCKLSHRTPVSAWYEVAEVDDESYAYELLYHPTLCRAATTPYLC